MESFIVNALSHPATLVLAKVVLTLVFWMAGLFGLFNFKAIVQEMVEVKLPAPRLFDGATIATQLLGSAVVIFNPGGFGWLGAGALAVFLILTIPIAHPFWRFNEPKRTPEFHIVLEHITVVGGLMTAAILSIQA